MIDFSNASWCTNMKFILQLALKIGSISQEIVEVAPSITRQRATLLQNCNFPTKESS